MRQGRRASRSWACQARLLLARSSAGSWHQRRLGDADLVFLHQQGDARDHRKAMLLEAAVERRFVAPDGGQDTAFLSMTAHGTLGTAGTRPLADDAQPMGEEQRRVVLGSGDDPD